MALNTGTAALHSAVLVAGVKPGDEVIIPSFTFHATAEVVLMTGAEPVFADIDPDTYTITAETVEAVMTGIQRSSCRFTCTGCQRTWTH